MVGRPHRSLYRRLYDTHYHRFIRQDFSNIFFVHAWLSISFILFFSLKYLKILWLLWLFFSSFFSLPSFFFFLLLFSSFGIHQKGGGMGRLCPLLNPRMCKCEIINKLPVFRLIRVLAAASLMMTWNPIGPSLVPWGTPAASCRSSECVLLNLIHCRWF